MKIFTPFFLSKKLRLLLLFLTITLLPSLKVSAQICSDDLSSFYQTMTGNNSYGLQGISFKRFNLEQSKFEEEDWKRLIYTDNVQNSGAHASAFSKQSGYVYTVADPASNGILLLAVFEPELKSDGIGMNFNYVGKVIFPVKNSVPNSFQNLFTTSEGDIGFISGTETIFLANVTNVLPKKNGPYNALTNLREVSMDKDVAYAADAAYYKDHIYTLAATSSNNSALLRKINCKTGNVTKRTIILGLKPHQNVQDVFTTNETTAKYGATWIDADGDFYTANNSTGRIFQIKEAFNETSITLLHAFNSIPSGNNDGFSCEDLSLKPIVKTKNPDCSKPGSAYIDNYQSSATYELFDITENKLTIITKGQGSEILNLKPGNRYKIRRKFELFTSSYSDEFSIETRWNSPPEFILTPSNICTTVNATGNITLTTSSLGITYTLTGPTGFNPITTLGTGAILSWGNLPEGDYTVTAKTSNGCPLEKNTSIRSFPPPEKPILILTSNAACNTSGSFTIVNYDSTLIYTIVPSQNTLQNGALVTVNPGTYTVTATNMLNGCTSSGSEEITIISLDVLPPPPSIINPIQPTCEQLTGSFQIENYLDDGSFTISTTATYNITTSGLVTGNPGIYTITFTGSNNCTSKSIIELKPKTKPAVPILSPKTDPSCTNPNGTFSIDNYNPAFYSYSISPNPVSKNNATITGVGGVTYTVVVTNTDGCTSQEQITLIEQPDSPPNPIITEIVHPSCNELNGSFKIGNFDTDISLKYTITPSNLGIILDGNTISAPSGDYTITLTKNNNCDSKVTFKINQPPTVPLAPIVTPTQPDCDTKKGILTVTVVDHDLLYSFDNGLNWQEDNRMSNLEPGPYSVKVKNIFGCESTSIISTIDPLLPIPNIPDIEASQPNCTTNTGSIEVTIQNTTDQYSFDGGANFQTENSKSGLTAGNYNIYIKNNHGCLSEVKNVTIDSPPTIPQTPNLEISQPDCNTPRGSFTITNYQTNVTYTLTGTNPVGTPIIQTTARFDNLDYGQYNLVAINTTAGCPAPEMVTLEIVEPKCPSISLVKTATFNDEDGDTFAKANETITYHFTITNTGNIPLTNINLSDLLPGIAIHSETGTLSLQPRESNSTFFSATYSVLQTDIFKRFVTNTATISAESTAGKVEGISTYTIPLDPGSACDINVYNVVSANDDGKNDLFEIGGLDCYPENSLQIYNRWGVLVFERNPYNNSDKAFKGFSEGRVTISSKEKLPTGTYFYILKYRDNDANWHNKSGYLYLSL